MATADSSPPKNATLIIEPPKILNLMPQTERARSIMLLDLDAEPTSADSLRLRLNIIFKPIVIRRGHFGRTDYYVGTTGGSVVLSGSKAAVVAYTGPEWVLVEYEINKGREVARSTKLLGDIATNIGAANVGVKPGSVEHANKNTVAFGAKFESKEALLAATNLGDTVEWQIDSHRGEKVVRDFLICNVFLEAVFRWGSVAKTGTAQIRPSNVSFYDSLRRQLPTRASILMAYVLWRKGIHIENRDGIQITFAERTNE